jgi:hypothetical protein
MMVGLEEKKGGWWLIFQVGTVQANPDKRVPLPKD